MLAMNIYIYNKFESVCMMMESVISPPRSNTFPWYIECEALEMANAPPSSSSMSWVKYDPKVLMCVDLEIKESREDVASSDDTDCDTSSIFRT